LVKEKNEGREEKRKNANIATWKNGR